MFKALIIFTLLIYISLDNHAQTYVFKFRAVKGKLWGYADINGKTIIEPQYPFCNDFADNGIALVFFVKYEYGDFIRLNGEYIKPEPEEFSLNNIMGRAVQGYAEGFVAVKNNNKWGYLNSQGKIAIPFKYDEASYFNNGYAIVKSGKSFLVLDTTGTETKINIDEIKLCRPFIEGRAPIFLKTDKFGFINTKGNIVIEPEFAGVGYFYSGIAWARALNNNIGFIDTTGKWVIEPLFDIAMDFDTESGMAQVRKDGKWVFVNKTGQIFDFDMSERIIGYSEGLARGIKEGLTGFYNNEGKWIIQPKYENARDFKNGYAAVEFEGKWGFIDKKGNWIIQPTYSALGDVVIVK
ncbi:MAG: WG repeat-containing protein [Bacteroidia bacterium]|nr:WG repeat-containing protein [Bacteroidia bacterium]